MMDLVENRKARKCVTTRGAACDGSATMRQRHGRLDGDDYVQKSGQCEEEEEEEEEEEDKEND